MNVNDLTLSNVFTPNWTTNTLSYATNAASSTTPFAVWSEPTMTKASRRSDPLEWLGDEIERYVELGTLHD